MPEPDEIRPADAAADPAPSVPAPPSFGHDEPARADGELRIPTPFRLQAPWWAAESTDSDGPEPDEPATVGASAGPAADTAPPAVPAPDDRLVAGPGAPGVDSRRAVPRPRTGPPRNTAPDGTPVHPPTGTGPRPPSPGPVSPGTTGPLPGPARSGATGPLPVPGPARSGTTGPLPTIGETPSGSATGTGPLPVAGGAAQGTDASSAVMPLNAPLVAHAAPKANTDSRASGPVLTPDAILPPGVEPPPGVVLPPSEKVVKNAPRPDAAKQQPPRPNGRATAVDMPVVPPTPQPVPQAAAAAPPTPPQNATTPAPPPPDASGSTAFGAPRRPFPGPDAPNDGTTGPQPFPRGPLGNGPNANPLNRKRLLIGGGIAAAIVAVCGIAVAGMASGSDGGKPKSKAGDKPSAPGRSASPSPSGPVHHPVDINSDKTDTRPLALTEVFPSPTIELGGRAFQRDRSSVNHQCGLTARGSMAEALAHDGCRAVVRVTFVSDNKKFAVTSGVAVLPNHEAALRVSRAGNPGKYEWFRGLTGPHAPDIDGTGGYAAATVRGRYVAYAYATYTDGTRITPEDTQIKGLAQEFLDYGTKALDTRARG
ncbi:hypothetical protein [Actinomadura harenae]|uniref:Uncharacterized protein n=1 Tax=Actinomadura harenae TaxID=2483351 RepID=A0A3M2M5M4_9ACTN|nr:hypothetical protein [Actinomadura harenae]RMI45054.1 hypothetical protein EBO15_10790 [Actinomadura harenae]